MPPMMTPKDLLLKRFQCPLGVKTIDRVLNGEPVDEDMAKRLARIYDTTPELWLKAQEYADKQQTAQDEAIARLA